MSRPRLITWVVLTLASAAAADNVTATLEPALSERGEFFQPATLTVHNATDTTIRFLRIQWQLGGPTFVHHATIPPGGSKDLAVALPAMTRHQRFRVDAGLEAGDAIVTEAEITWPIDWVDPSVWIDPQAYEPYEGLEIGWSDSLRRLVWWSAAIGCVLLVASMAVPRAKWRMASAGAVIVIGLAVACYVGAQPVATNSHVSADRRTSALFVKRQTRLLSWNSALTPIYATRAQMMEDDAVYSDGLWVTLKPGHVRLFRSPHGDQE